MNYLIKKKSNRGTTKLKKCACMNWMKKTKLKRWAKIGGRRYEQCG